MSLIGYIGNTILLAILGKRVPPSSRLILVGGSALAMLGSTRLTIDIDFIGDDMSPDELQKFIIQVAKERKIVAEAVALDRFIPLPNGSDQRMIHIGRFGNLEVFSADPYSIALSKLDRGFDTDIDDIIFLVKRHLIDIPKLERIMKEALPRAHEFDMNATEVMAHFKVLKDRSR
ncbi:MAG: DUF6036 family nucleotidyltransferase [Anaerolineales bacterium]